MPKTQVNETLRKLVYFLRKLGISESTTVKIMCQVVEAPDHTEAAEQILEATKNCKTEEEILAAIQTTRPTSLSS